MNGFINWLIKVLIRRQRRHTELNCKDSPRPALASSHDEDIQAKINFSVIKAMNGTAIRVGTFKPNPHGPDWTYELYLVGEHQSLADAFTTILAIKAITK